MNIFDIAKQNQEKAWQVIKNTNIIQIWEDAGAKINLVGSLRTGPVSYTHLTLPTICSV